MEWTNADTVAVAWAAVAVISFALGWIVRGYKESDK
jgi:hypothetical protein